MSKAPKPPPPPDPNVVAAAQTKSNKETAVANAYLNRVDQTNPFGSSQYTVVGTNPDGTPKFAQNTQFSEPLQQNFNTYFGLNNALGQSAQGQLGRVQDMLATPFDLNSAAEGKINDLMGARLNPQLQQADEQLRNRLTQQGIREGTESWDRAMTRQGQIANDARNSMWLAARQQGVGEAMTQRQFPLQEFNSLFRGQQPQTPQFGGIPAANMANTDVAGITQAGYNNQMAAWNAQNNQNNAFMGGLFQMGAAAVPLFSDRRLKREIERVGALPSGLPVYRYRYLWSDEPQIGVMADEAREMFPGAVFDVGGFFAVDYGKVG
jgi:hypothetical protein